MDEINALCAAISESWNSSVTSSFNKLAKALGEWEICIRKENKSKAPAYNYKPIERRNLPYQRRNF